MYLGPRQTSASVKVLFVNFILSGAEVARSERIAAVLTSMIGADWHLGMRGPHVQAHVDISASVPLKSYLKFCFKWDPALTIHPERGLLVYSKDNWNLCFSLPWASSHVQI